MFDAFLDWFDRNKVGVIGTLALHTLLLFVLTLWGLPTVPRDEDRSEMRIEVVSSDEVEEILERIDAGEDYVPQQVTNLSSNITAELAKPSFSNERLAQSVEEDLRAMEQAEFDRLAEERRERGEEIEMPQLDPSKWDKERYMEKAAEPVRVEGATTVWHDLQGRVRANDVPGYLCRTQGRVAIRVSVDRAGNVLRADLDQARSSQVDECMLEHALRSAKRARFSPNASATDPQNGTVFFLFLAQ